MTAQSTRLSDMSSFQSEPRMALDIVVTTSRWKNDPISRSLVSFLEQHQVDLGLSDGVVYYDFPAYADYEDRFSGLTSFSCHRHMVSSPSGLSTRAYSSSLARASARSTLPSAISSATCTPGSFAAGNLRKGRTDLIVDIHPVVFLSAVTSRAEIDDDIESTTCRSLEGLADFLKNNVGTTLGPSTIAEVRSVVEGAKALSRPNRRSVQEFATASPSAPRWRGSRARSPISTRSSATSRWWTWAVLHGLEDWQDLARR